MGFGSNKQKQKIHLRVEIFLAFPDHEGMLAKERIRRKRAEKTFK
jgi:hypothetical protein